MVWLEFLLCGLVIWVAGSRLCRYAEVIAEKSGSSRTWVGMILLASATSLPELTAGISAAGFARSPDIAIGDVLGSCVFNLTILAAVDGMYRHAPVYTRASQGHILSAGFSIIMLGFVGFDILVSTRGHGIAVAHVGGSSFLLLAIYALAARTVFRYESEHPDEYFEKSKIEESTLSLRAALAMYALWSLLVLAGGTALPFVGEEIAQTMGWRESFVGNLFVAAATSAPELAVTIAAVRTGTLDLAIGNLLGSNLFNMVVLALDDVVYRDGRLLADGSAVHASSVMTAVMMTGIAIVGLRFRPRTRLFHAVGWTSLALITLYALNAYVFYLFQ
jgi:cation:H+ antiporter